MHVSGNDNNKHGLVGIPLAIRMLHDIEEAAAPNRQNHILEGHTAKTFEICILLLIPAKGLHKNRLHESAPFVISIPFAIAAWPPSGWGQAVHLTMRCETSCWRSRCTWSGWGRGKPGCLCQTRLLDIPRGGTADSAHVGSGRCVGRGGAAGGDLRRARGPPYSVWHGSMHTAPWTAYRPDPCDPETPPRVRAPPRSIPPPLAG